ncbi:unnamed protein product [Didymodactylos carnosus]|uniref:Tetratricopeptide repeat protein n=1 Tax=Didymodactylos carnosus TaxID=1234261 RepID=A0A815A2I0_9BILA|nr:unnamed protein product [Didymodactylos carnosus]CAF1348119.1 unnamed protein product [Didymodactylos carnosus]CAF4018168.1 unnamed protein product [Didymodactylos carnosus]CAF4158953.1 unnamed protein product [Didymodactylos carnosus]
MDGNIMTRMGFFINDLHRQIDQLHKEQHMDEIFTVYRGQDLSKADFKQLTQTKEVSLPFAERAVTNPDLVGILFVMKIDSKQSTTSFASVRGISYFRDDDEVLSSMHTVFRIQETRQIDENSRLFEVSLILTSDTDVELNALTERIREESYTDEEGRARLGLVLENIGQNDKAEEIYEMLLDQRTEESEKAPIYHQLGWIKDNQGKYPEAIKYYEKSLAIKEKTLPPNDLQLAVSYNNIGMMYSNIGSYTKALPSHGRALTIRKQSLPPNHLDLAMSYNNIGLAYSNTEMSIIDTQTDTIISRITLHYPPSGFLVSPINPSLIYVRQFTISYPKGFYPTDDGYLQEVNIQTNERGRKIKIGQNGFFSMQ